MFIHLGGDNMIRTTELVAIFDLSIEKSSTISKSYIQKAIELKKVEFIGEEEYKSLVVTFSKIYYSPISSTTLKKRASQVIT